MEMENLQLNDNRKVCFFFPYQIYYLYYFSIKSFHLKNNLIKRTHV